MGGLHTAAPAAITISMTIGNGPRRVSPGQQLLSPGLNTTPALDWKVRWDGETCFSFFGAVGLIRVTLRSDNARVLVAYRMIMAGVGAGLSISPLIDKVIELTDHNIGRTEELVAPSADEFYPLVCHAAFSANDLDGGSVTASIVGASFGRGLGALTLRCWHRSDKRGRPLCETAALGIPRSRPGLAALANVLAGKMLLDPTRPIYFGNDDAG
jgi:hypothetical protein